MFGSGVRYPEAWPCKHVPLYKQAQATIWEKTLEARAKTNNARRKFSGEFFGLGLRAGRDSVFFCTDAVMRELCEKWKQWDQVTIENYRLQFSMIDTDNDGLIDFMEL